MLNRGPTTYGEDLELRNIYISPECYGKDTMQEAALPRTGGAPESLTVSYSALLGLNAAAGFHHELADQHYTELVPV